MQKKTSEIKPAVRYSEAFKMQVVRELEAEGIDLDQIRRKYGIGARGSIRGWIGKYGNGQIGKIIHVQTPKETNG